MYSAFAHFRVPAAVAIFALLLVIVSARGVLLNAPPTSSSATSESMSADGALLRGEIVCLPTSNRMQDDQYACALGLKVATDVFVALRDSDPRNANLASAGLGIPVTVTGRLLPAPSFSHNIVGILQVHSIRLSEVEAQDLQTNNQLLIGTFVCLPQVGENEGCIEGFHAQGGDYYALDTAQIDGTAAHKQLNSSSTVVLTGSVFPIEGLSSDQWQNYDIEGIIIVEGVGTL